MRMSALMACGVVGLLIFGTGAARAVDVPYPVQGVVAGGDTWCSTADKYRETKGIPVVHRKDAPPGRCGVFRGVQVVLYIGYEPLDPNQPLDDPHWLYKLRTIRGNVVFIEYDGLDVNSAPPPQVAKN